MNSLSGLEQYKLDNPDANLPEPGSLAKREILFSRNFIMNSSIT